MSDRREAAARSPGAANSGTPPGPAADRERVILLECRLEQMRSALSAAREEADSARTKLAESCAREADHARRFGEIHAELADARAELAALHRRLERSEALKSEIEGYLFEAGAQADTDELARLRKRVLVEDQRALVNDRTLARLRWRVEDLAATRETLLTRVAEWQQMIRNEGPDAADLSEFLAELRREILELEHRNVTSDAREMVLRQRLAMAGIDPDGEPEPLQPRVEEPVVPEPTAVVDEAAAVNAAEEEREQDEPAAASHTDGSPIADSGSPADADEQSRAATADEQEPAATADEQDEPAGVTDETEEPQPSADLVEPAAETVQPVEPVEPVVTAENEAPAQHESSDEVEAPIEQEPALEQEPAVEPVPAAPVGGDSERPSPPRPARLVESSAEPEQAARAVSAQRSEPTPAPERVQPRSRAEALIADLMAAESSPRRADLLLQLGRSGDEGAHNMIRPWTESLEPSVRAAAYEALGRLLERAPERLEPHLRTGLADPDARVRRRVALAAATARGMTPRRLLEPLKEDPDPQVRRVVREVLRQSPRTGPEPRVRSEAAPPPPVETSTAGPSGPDDVEKTTSVPTRSLRAR